jgi:D-glycero-D-manno-heptose 1,7-bisphosphate phosphatase
MMYRALFLDRDGVINVDHAYVCKPESFEFVDGIFDLVRRARELGYLVIVVTNQAGIGRGYFSEDEFLALTEWMRAEFASRGAAIDAVYFCPDHPLHGLGRYRRDSPMRKPAPGMLLQARDEFGIDMARSVMVGDKRTDMQAGAAAGVGTLLWLNPNEEGGPGEPVFSLPQAACRLRPA